MCRAPIFFLTREPTRQDPNPKNLPIDVNPSPSGTVAIYERPSRDSVAIDDRNFKGERKRYFRQIYHEALKSYIRLGGAVYTIHFDTCKQRGGRHY